MYDQAQVASVSRYVIQVIQAIQVLNTVVFLAAKLALCQPPEGNPADASKIQRYEKLERLSIHQISVQPTGTTQLSPYLTVLLHQHF